MYFTLRIVIAVYSMVLATDFALLLDQDHSVSLPGSGWRGTLSAKINEHTAKPAPI